MHIAVYGTLKKGFGNHRLLDPRGFSFVGSFVSVNKFHMTSAGGFPIVYKDQPLHHIGVEVYKVTDPAYLSQVDRLEGHPNWYKREPVKFQNDNETIEAEMYMQEAPTRGKPYYNNIRIVGPVANWVRTHD